ncbi:hypothetical protein [Mesorhizobium sp.]|uniref:hypothetical protein n=1 Tax=Mesorhizobium sp. TaxID=1871066 RepID=UPI000FE8259D|nr:hypothetical protein [Mesorhizobium sp.]RWK12499.1 MAG: hypothetical protein EOR39_02555 [Mesorhizobium sp.]
MVELAKPLSDRFKLDALIDDLADDLKALREGRISVRDVYKFQMFGYWAAIWVHLNRIGEFKRNNPWRDLVKEARKQ